VEGYGVFSWVIGGMIERMRGADESIMLEVYRTPTRTLLRSWGQPGRLGGGTGQETGLIRG